MIKNAWERAGEKGLIYTHPVNKAEYVNLDVDSFKATTKLQKNEMKMEAALTVEDLRTCLSCVCAACKHFHASWVLRTWLCTGKREDSDGLLLDFPDGQEPGETPSSAALPAPPPMKFGLRYFMHESMHACMANFYTHVPMHESK